MQHEQQELIPLPEWDDLDGVKLRLIRTERRVLQLTAYAEALESELTKLKEPAISGTLRFGETPALSG